MERMWRDRADGRIDARWLADRDRWIRPGAWRERDGLEVLSSVCGGNRRYTGMFLRAVVRVSTALAG